MVLGFVVSATWVSAAQAQDTAVNFSGFGTLGVTAQHGAEGWGFQRTTSQPGAQSKLSASQDTRVGLQANWNPNPTWEGALQVVAAQRPVGAPASESVEWAYAGYRPFTETRLRLGRVSPDIFLFADSRNVGFAFPWARPPADFYGFAPGTSVDGVDVEQRWSLGDATWRARFTAGEFGTSVTGNDGERYPLAGRHIVALGLTRESGGLLLKASYFRGRVRIDTGADAQQLQLALAQLATLPVPGLADSIAGLQGNLWNGGAISYVALGAQYETGPWTVIAEGSDLRVPGSPLDGKRAYLSVGYRHHDVTYYSVVSRVKPDRQAVVAPDVTGSLTPVLGAAGAAGAQQAMNYAAQAGAVYRFDQSTVGAGLRWDCTPRAAVKLQVDRFDVHANGAAGWRHGDAREAHGVLVSVLLDFIWGQ